MRVIILSDLHFEMMKDIGRSFLEDSYWPNHDVCIIAGDLCSSKNIIKSIKRTCKVFKEVVYVTGNHEYYNSSIKDIDKKISKLKIKNFHFLDQNEVTIKGQRFVGGTMWFPKEPSNMIRENFINDFISIKDCDYIYEKNKLFNEYIQGCNLNSDDIVITHHLPSYKSVNYRYTGNIINYFFVNNIEVLIKEYQPKLWIHGHTHFSFDYMIDKTRVICNPLGYKFEIDQFRPKTIEI
jgi:Icc-related predicted phosphoesterase